MLVLLCGGELATSVEPVAAAAVALAPAAKGGPRLWRRPELIAGYELGSGQPQPMAFDESGNAFAVFTEPVLEAAGLISPSYLVRVAVRPAGGHWRTPETLSHRGVDPTVAVGAQGEAIAVWENASSLEEAERPSGGNWLASKAVLTPGGEEPQVAADAKGDVLIASTRQASNHSEGIEVTARSAGGVFSPSRTISGNENAFEPRVAMNAHGDALLAWRVDTARGCPVRAVLRLAGGGWSRPRTISGVDAFCEGGNHRVAIDEHGDAIVTWFAQRGRLMYVEEATRGADGRWRTRSVLARARNVLRPEVAMDARGDAIVAWSQDGHEWVRTRRAGRRWLAAQMVTSSQGSPASLALDARGDALLAWSARGGIVAATKRSMDAKWQISSVASGFGEPTAGIDPRGDGVVAWLTNKDLNIAWGFSPLADRDPRVAGPTRVGANGVKARANASDG